MVRRNPARDSNSAWGRDAVSGKCVNARRHRNTGQTLVEFALVLPLLLLFIMGVVDMGRLIYAYSSAGNAAHEGVRTAIVNQNKADIQAIAARQATGLGLLPGDPGGCPNLVGPTTTPSVNGTCVAFDDPPNLATNCATPYIGCVAVVTVKYSFQAITPIIGNIIGKVDLVLISKQPIESVCSGSGCPTP